jgi:hypothetical protein
VFGVKDQKVGFDLHEDVLCGSCHGDAMAHASNPSLFKPLKPQMSICESCHNVNQSPKFEYAAYLRKLGCVTFKNRK